MSEETSRAPRATHYLVGDKQDVMLIADLSNLAKIAVHRRNRSERCANNRLGDKCRCFVGANLFDRSPKITGSTTSIVRFGLAAAHVAIRIAGCNARPVMNNAFIMHPARQIACDRQCAHGIAVIAELPAYDDRLARAIRPLTVLPGEFQRRFVGSSEPPEVK